MNAPPFDIPIQAFRDVDFNWALRLQDIWKPTVGDVPDMHQNARRQLLDDANRLNSHPDQGNPLGWFLTGSGGTGKTHLLNALQHQLVQRGFGFILVDMTDVRDFWETVAQSYYNSLQNTLTDGRPQYAFFLERFSKYLNPDQVKAQNNLRVLAQGKSSKLKDDLDRLLKALAVKHPRETLRYQDTIRALICLNSVDFEISNMGSSWLLGLDMDEVLRKLLKFQKPSQSPIEIVRSLSWLMSLTGPTVLAFDQLDPIVHQVARQTTVKNIDEQNTARWIIDQIGNGFGALRDTTTRTMVLVSCIEETYTILTREAFSSNLARFNTPIRLVKPTPRELESLIRCRLAISYSKHGFNPPHPTWPFNREAFQSIENDTPRRILQLCDEHRRQCIQDSTITELKSFHPQTKKLPPVSPGTLEELDRQFASIRAQATLTPLLDEQKEDGELAQIYQAAMQCLLIQNEPLPEGIHAIVEKEFGGGKTNRPLHARLRLIMQNDNEREEHYCVRAIQKINHAAFKTRLKAAITQAGIDRTLTFRKLTVVRRGKFPGGKETEKLIADFKNKGGKFHDPTDEELRTLYALHELLQKTEPNFLAWLKIRKPLDQLKLADVLANDSLFSSKIGTLKEPTPPPVQQKDPTNTKTGSTPGPLGSPIPPNSPQTNPTPNPRLPTMIPKPKVNGESILVLGQKIIGPERYGDSDGPQVGILAKHTVVLAGAGSGKTVLLYRLVEEAALLGIPSIVIDCANDLSSFDETKESSPHWLPDDKDRAERFKKSSEMILWTPGKESGNPLTLQPLPDFEAVKGDPEDLRDAILMAYASLAGIVAKGATEKALKKTGILQSSLEYFGRTYKSGTLGDYVDMLKDLPEGAGPGVNKEKTLAVEMADALRVEMRTNPLLNTTGVALDPAVLFGDDHPRDATRISVISFLGLPTLTMQCTFLNQLAMILFSWIKKNPNPPGRPLRGLLVIDEARDFVPSQKTSECKESLIRLGAQARKYGLGIVFATQHPKDIEHKLIGNCSTHFYGLNNSPASLATLQEQMKLKGGNGDDIARLKVGQFYFHSTGSTQTAPIKLKIPDCFSNKRLLEEHEILTKARDSRRLVENRE